MLKPRLLSSFWQHGQQINSGLCIARSESCTRGGGAGWYATLAFADADGIWRYPVTIEDVSPLTLKR